MEWIYRTLESNHSTLSCLLFASTLWQFVCSFTSACGFPPTSSLLLFDMNQLLGLTHTGIFPRKKSLFRSFIRPRLCNSLVLFLNVSHAFQFCWCPQQQRSEKYQVWKWYNCIVRPNGFHHATVTILVAHIRPKERVCVRESAEPKHSRLNKKKYKNFTENPIMMDENRPNMFDNRDKLKREEDRAKERCKSWHCVCVCAECVGFVKRVYFGNTDPFLSILNQYPVAEWHGWGQLRSGKRKSYCKLSPEKRKF